MKMNKEVKHLDQFVVTLYFHTVCQERLINRILHETNSTLTKEDLHRFFEEISEKVSQIPFNESLEGIKRAYKAIPFDSIHDDFKLKDYL